jgi:monoamine oxidase
MGLLVNADAGRDFDVIVIGAGAAGISAAVELAAAGLRCTILEARDRIGGRIFTVIDPLHNHPVELGAEFIHGRPPEILDLLRAAKVSVHETAGDHWCAENGQLRICDFSSDLDKILRKLDDQEPDQSFLDFLKTYSGEDQKPPRQRRAEQWATSYVSGFNAADPALVGVHWLVEGMRADEKIEGHRTFRAKHGYADLIEIFRQQLKQARVPMRVSTVVHSISWKPGRVEVTAGSPQGVLQLSAARVVITVPLGVLQAAADERGSIQFNPELPPTTQSAIRNILMGKVIRVTLRFRDRFWAGLPKNRGSGGKTLDEMGFLFSHDDWFPTWWSTLPNKSPFLVGWAPFLCAERLSGRGDPFIVDKSIETLSRLLSTRKDELQALLEHAYLHDWQTDPFARGAYSYGKAGHEHAPRDLSTAIEGTLFFAGEATDLNGHTGTVHGAMSSGRRAAAQIVKAAPNSSSR